MRTKSKIWALGIAMLFAFGMNVIPTASAASHGCPLSGAGDDCTGASFTYGQAGGYTYSPQPDLDVSGSLLAAGEYTVRIRENSFANIWIEITFEVTVVGGVPVIASQTDAECFDGPWGPDCPRLGAPSHVIGTSSNSAIAVTHVTATTT